MLDFPQPEWGHITAVSTMPAGPTRRWIEAKKGAQLQFDLSKEEAFVDDQDLLPTAKEAALSI